MEVDKEKDIKWVCVCESKYVKWEEERHESERKVERRRGREKKEGVMTE